MLQPQAELTFHVHKSCTIAYRLPASRLTGSAPVHFVPDMSSCCYGRSRASQLERPHVRGRHNLLRSVLGYSQQQKLECLTAMTCRVYSHGLMNRNSSTMRVQPPLRKRMRGSLRSWSPLRPQAPTPTPLMSCSMVRQISLIWLRAQHRMPASPAALQQEDMISFGTDFAACPALLCCSGCALLGNNMRESKHMNEAF